MCSQSDTTGRSDAACQALGISKNSIVARESQTEASGVVLGGAFGWGRGLVEGRPRLSAPGSLWALPGQLRPGPVATFPSSGYLQTWSETAGGLGRLRSAPKQSRRFRLGSLVNRCYSWG